MIREMRSSDREPVISLEQKGNWNPWSWEQFKLSSLKSTPSRNTVYIEENSKDLLGYLCSSIIPPEAEIQNICVNPESRRQHIGQKLLEDFIDWSEDNNITKIFLEVREKNLPAKSLYRKYHFELLDIRKNYYHNPIDNALLYALKLN